MTDFQVATHCIGFAPGIVPAWSDTSFTDSDLAAALFTTGRAPGDEARHGWASVAEFVHRAALIPAYVRRRTLAGGLRKIRAVPVTCRFLPTTGTR